MKMSLDLIINGELSDYERKITRSRKFRALLHELAALVDHQGAKLDLVLFLERHEDEENTDAEVHIESGQAQKWFEDNVGTIPTAEDKRIAAELSAICEGEYL